MITRPPPLSLYIHMPWCVKKCPYCDFNAHPKRGDLPKQNYLDALIADLTADLPKIWGREIVSIFFGGGTPSLFTGAEYEYLLNQLRALVPFSQNIEITLEANPGTIECDSFEAYYQAGINRISLGVQSFDDTLLQKLGRIHTSDVAIKAVENLKKAGFDNFNLDIMHGLPGQTCEMAMADLNQAIDLNPAHISWYQLTMEPNTLFYVQNPELPDENTLADIELEGFEVLKAHQFERYEISAFSRKGKQSRHNVNYWQFGDYLGIGAGAHSKLTFVDSNQIMRTLKHKHPKAYLAAEGGYIQDESEILQADLPLEFMLNAMRLTDGVPLEIFESRTGINRGALSSSFEAAKAKGLLEVTENQVKPTVKGILYLNDLLSFW